jgi:hypothetical protein
MGKALTLIMPYYDNAGILSLHYREWSKNWPVETRERFKVILVDDGSEIAPAGAVARPRGLPPLEIWRVTENRPWHQHAARNLGAHVASDGWLLLTDMDHVLEADSAKALLERLPKLDKGTIHTLDRIEADSRKPTLGVNKQPKPHPNSFVLTRDLYWKIGGYDEEFCGQYGTDGFFRSRAFRKAKRGHIDVPLVRYWRDLISDASTTSLPRKEGREPGAKEKVIAAKIARGEPDSVKVLQFDWERVI